MSSKVVQVAGGTKIAHTVGYKGSLDRMLFYFWKRGGWGSPIGGVKLKKIYFWRWSLEERRLHIPSKDKRMQIIQSRDGDCEAIPQKRLLCQCLRNFHRRMSIFGFTKESRDRRQRDANSTTMMLIVVIAVFLAVEIPLSVISALHTISSRWSIGFFQAFSNNRRKIILLWTILTGSQSLNLSLSSPCATLPSP